jgi:DNA modification methylase
MPRPSRQSRPTAAPGAATGLSPEFWPANAVERRPLASLTPYATNARTHSTEQVDAIAASIREWGWTIPVLVDEDGTIIAGHARVMAADRLGLAEVPVMVARGWPEAKRKAYVLADNKLALQSDWDEDLLAAEMAKIREAGFELSLTGFSDAEVFALFDRGKERQTDPDDVPEPPSVALSRPGDVWILGGHRLRCGDSTSAADVEALLAGAKPHLMVTDPPYGVEYDPNWRNERARTSALMGNRASGAGAVGKVLNDDRADWREAWALFPGDVAYVWCASLHSHTVAESLLATEFELRSQVIWDKTRLAIGRGHYQWQHEPCWYAVRKGGSGHWHGDRKQTTVWPIVHTRSETGHGTQKPVECMKRPIENNSEVGDAVYEPFSGSGTTLIAAEMTGRRCYAMELNPPYVDVAVRRWQEFTGGAAILEGDGRTFAKLQEAGRVAPAA